MSCHLWNSFIFFLFSVYESFISFSHIITLTRISSMILNRSNGGGYHCPVPYFRGRWSSFLHLSMMLTVDFFVYVFYKVDEVTLFIVCWELLVMNGCWILWNVFSLSIWSYFSFCLLWWLDYFNCFSFLNSLIFEPALHTWG